MSGVEAVHRLQKGEISPELVEASAWRVAEVEPAVNALSTLCLDRARDAAQRASRSDEEAEELKPAKQGSSPRKLQQNRNLAHAVLPEVEPG